MAVVGNNFKAACADVYSGTDKVVGLAGAVADESLMDVSVFAAAIVARSCKVVLSRMLVSVSDKPVNCFVADVP